MAIPIYEELWFLVVPMTKKIIIFKKYTKSGQKIDDNAVFYKISCAVNIPTINRINPFISDNNNDYTIFC